MTRTHFYLTNPHGNDAFLIGQGALSCTAEGWKEQAVQGQLLDFDSENRILKIQPLGQLRPIGLRFSQLKRLRIDARPGIDLDPADANTHSLGLAPGQSYLVFLRDGAVSSGLCVGLRKTEQGLWVFPKRALESDPYRVFFPKNAIVRFDLRSGEDARSSDTDFAQSILQEWEQTQPMLVDAVENVAVETYAGLQQALQRQSTLKPVPVGETLVGLGKITSEQLNAVLRLQQAEKSRQPLGQLLLEKGLVTAADLQTAFARKMGYPFVNLAKYPVDAAALRRLSFATALRLQVLPIAEIETALVVAMSDPLQFKVIDEVEFTTQRKVIPVVSVSAELSEKIKKSYREVGLSDLAGAAVGSRPDVARSAPAPDPQMESDAVQLAVELVGVAAEEFDDKPIEQSDNTLVRLINSMIAEAYHQGASDIHIEPYPGREKIMIRFRIDGQMRPYLELPASYRNALVARIKIMCDLDISERRKPQDGKINFAKFGGLPLELRVATIPTANGLEDVVLRLLSSSTPLTLDQLLLSPHNLQRFEALVERPYGFFLCVGPTGSGKTTTLHSALQRINTPNRKIWTAEDPVEITQRGLRQIHVNPKIGWTFAVALRTLLRADPDVIMVGEIRDHETAEIAIEASLTGHLVFSTLHTNSAAETVVRLIDLGVDPFSFADSLQGVLAQRLARCLCPHCAVSQPMSSEQVQELLLDYQNQLPVGHPLRDGAALSQDWMRRYGKQGRLHMSLAPGCDQCGKTGYAGRLALHELLCNSPELRHLIQRRAHSAEIQNLAVNEGMRTLRQDGIEKVLQGLTSLAEVRSNTVN